MTSSCPSLALKYDALPPAFFNTVEPASIPAARLYEPNPNLAKAIGLDAVWLRSREGLELLSGQATSALAMAYSGHQFGHWSGLLGDGRAKLVGTATGPDGQVRELHLKGSGKTHYSRGGDGKATLGAVIREYIVSEAMAGLGVPTTRALSIVTTGEKIQREQVEPGAILCRTARSHVRVGTYQYAASLGDRDILQALADFTIDRLYPELPANGLDRYAGLLSRVVEKQAVLIAKWMGLGFIHGVMNTDNVCISGETIDYGPCAFMDEFHPAKVFSSIDRNGRYAWNRQPEIAHWNLARFAETLLPLLGDDSTEQKQRAEFGLNTFITLFQAEFNGVMARKLSIDAEHPELEAFIAETIKVMAFGKVDFTIFFSRLTRVSNGDNENLVTEMFADTDAGKEWIKSWKAVAGEISTEAIRSMELANPIIIPRNHRVEEAIAAANTGNRASFDKLLAAVAHPYTDHSEFSEYEAPPNPEEIVHQTFCGT